MKSDPLDSLKTLVSTMNRHERSSESVRTYLSALAYYLTSTKGRETPDKVNAFLDREKKLNKSAASRRMYYYAIKSLWKANGLVWDNDKIILPPMPQEIVTGPIFSEEEVITMIDTCKNLLHNVKEGSLTPHSEIARFCLASVYGFRVSEVARISKDTFTRKGPQTTLALQSSKRGEKRQHVIPKNIYWTVKVLQESGPMAVRSAQLIIKKIISQSKLDVTQYNDYGFHALRAAVITMLETVGTNPFDRIKFIGWKTPPTQDASGSAMTMLMRYTRPDLTQRDKRIYEKHTFLKRWEN